jgi:hypothetical protein
VRVVTEKQHDKKKIQIGFAAHTGRHNTLAHHAMGNCMGSSASFSRSSDGSAIEDRDRFDDDSRSTTSSGTSENSMVQVERNQSDPRLGLGTFTAKDEDDVKRIELFHLQQQQYALGGDNYSNIKEVLAKRGTLSFGAAKRTEGKGKFGAGKTMGDFEEKMPLQTLKIGRGKLMSLSGHHEGDVDSNMEDAFEDVSLGKSSNLQFDKVLRNWSKLKKKSKSSRRMLFFMGDGSKKKNDKGNNRRGKGKKERLRLWEAFLQVKKVTTDNPAWRHAQQTYSSQIFQEKVEYLFSTLDVNGVGFLEKHEFMFMLDGLRGRMHYFLRNTKALYFMQGQDEILPSDQEFVLSEVFKTSLVAAIQEQMFTWRMTPHAWAVDKQLFEDLVALIFCSTANLIMTDEGKCPVSVPVAVEFYLLMSSEDNNDNNKPPLIAAEPQQHQQQIQHQADSSGGGGGTSLFCKTVFDLHMICPPQSMTHVDETVLECSREEEEA